MQTLKPTEQIKSTELNVDAVVFRYGGGEVMEVIVFKLCDI